MKRRRFFGALFASAAAPLVAKAGGEMPVKPVYHWKVDCEMSQEYEAIGDGSLEDVIWHVDPSDSPLIDMIGAWRI